MSSASVESSMEVPAKIKTELLHDPAIPLLAISPKEMKTRVEDRVTHPCLL